jgi:hypothetical protein
MRATRMTTQELDKSDACFARRPQNAPLRCASHGQALLWCETRRRDLNALPDQIFPRNHHQNSPGQASSGPGSASQPENNAQILNSGVSVTGDWDVLEVQTPDDNKIQGKQVLDVLLRIEPGQLSGALLLCAANVREGIHLPQYGCC